MKSEIQQKIEALSKEIYDLKRQLSELRRKRPSEVVENYSFTNLQGNIIGNITSNITLSELFGTKQDLIVIHNMGKGCSYCTMWADGLESSLAHIQSKSAIAIASPDTPEVQKEFADSRNWSFQMVSTQNNSFTADMGFQAETHVMPGVSVFWKSDDGTIYRTNQDVFGPGDDFNPVWHLFDLLKGGSGDWQPQFSYS